MDNTTPTNQPGTEQESAEVTQLRLQIAEEIESAAARLAHAAAERDMAHAGPRDIVAMIQDVLCNLSSRLREQGSAQPVALTPPLPAYDLSHVGGSLSEERSAPGTDDGDPEFESEVVLQSPPTDTGGISVEEGSGEEPAVFRCVVCGEDAVIPYDNVLTCVSCGHAHE